MDKFLFSFYSPLTVDKRYRFNLEPETILKINANNDYSYTAFRKSSTAYANKKHVKQFVVKKYNNMCNNCNGNKDLHIDHVTSVKECYLKGMYVFCNSLENLQLLCSRCNIKKSSK